MRHLSQLWMVGLCSICMPVMPAQGPSSCFVSQDEASRVTTQSTRQLLARARVVIFTPCRGSVGGEALWVWFSPEEGKTQRRLVTPPRTLEQALGQTSTVLLSEGATLWQRLNAALTADATTKPGFSRFDSKYGIQLGGPVLPARDIRLPLAAFRWNPDEAVLLKDAAGKVLRLTPSDGRVLVPVSRLAVGQHSLSQGRLEARIEVPSEADVADLRAAIQEIEGEAADRGVRLLRRAILLSEHGYVLNLVSEYVPE